MLRPWESPAPAAPDPEALLEELWGLAPATWMRRVPGRETFVWPGRPERVVKRYLADDPREWWYERLVRPRRGAEEPAGSRLETRSPARREAENLERLLRAGHPVPRPLAWVEEASAARHPRLGGRAARSALVLERVPHESTLRSLLEERGERACRSFLAPLVETVARFHAEGWFHRDLYLEHFVVDERDGRLVVLDWARARREPSPRRRWLVKDLAALAGSTPGVVGERTLSSFLARWLRATGRPRGELAGWARAVEAKARALAAHAPRHVHSPGSAPAEGA